MTYIPRLPIEQQLIDAAVDRSPRIQVIEAPRGAGKSSLLRQVASRLPARGRLPVLIDFERICTSPVDFARYFPAAIAATLHANGIVAPRAEIIRSRLAEESSRRKPDPALLLDQALAFAEAAADASRTPQVLLLDEFAEVARLARHAGLRDALNIVARRLAPPSSLAIVASVSAASRPAVILDLLERETAGALAVRSLPPMAAGELASLVRGWRCDLRDERDDVELWMRATGGRPLYAEILARRVAQGADLATALAAEMTPPAGSLYQECRFDYHLLVERSRGHSVVRRILTLLSQEEGSHLSAIAQRLRIQLPTALDYLSWLLEVGLIRRDGRGYVYADPLLRLWVRLNGPEPVDLLEEVVSFLGTRRPAPGPPSRPRGRRPGATARPEAPQTLPRSRDLLIEID